MNPTTVVKLIKEHYPDFQKPEMARYYFDRAQLSIIFHKRKSVNDIEMIAQYGEVRCKEPYKKGVYLKDEDCLAQFIQALAENGYFIKQTQLMYGMTDKTTYEPKATNN